MIFMDVGQGDCILALSDDGSAALIDCGEVDYAPDVISLIKSIGIRKLDYVFVSHPHSDHMGGMGKIIRAFDIGTVIMPELPEEYIPATAAFDHLIDAFERKNCDVRYAEDGILEFGSGNFEITTSGYSGESLNDYSYVIKYTYGEKSFLFAGDLETDMEYVILERGTDLSADVYKLSHHGSSTSNCSLWLSAIDPEYIVCECGEGNPYGHPHREIVAAVSDYTDRLYRTDLDGDIIFITDGKSISVSTEK